MSWSCNHKTHWYHMAIVNRCNVVFLATCLMWQWMKSLSLPSICTRHMQILAYTLYCLRPDLISDNPAIITCGCTALMGIYKQSWEEMRNKGFRCWSDQGITHRIYTALSRTCTCIWTLLNSNVVNHILCEHERSGVFINPNSVYTSHTI